MFKIEIYKVLNKYIVIYYFDLAKKFSIFSLLWREKKSNEHLVDFFITITSTITITISIIDSILSHTKHSF